MITIRKGNLYDWKNGCIDDRLVDSSDYDVEIMDDGNLYRYRRRFKLNKGHFSVYALKTLVKLEKARKIEWYDLDSDIQKKYLMQKGLNEEESRAYMQHRIYNEEKKEIAVQNLIFGNLLFTMKMFNRIGGFKNFLDKTQFYDIEPFKNDKYSRRDSVCDILVEGGKGVFLIETLKKKPNIAYMLWDKDEVIERLRETDENCMQVMLSTGISEDLIRILSKHISQKDNLMESAKSIVNAKGKIRKDPQLREDLKCFEIDDYASVIMHFEDIKDIFYTDERISILYNFLTA